MALLTDCDTYGSEIAVDGKGGARNSAVEIRLLAAASTVPEKGKELSFAVSSSSSPSPLQLPVPLLPSSAVLRCLYLR